VLGFTQPRRNKHMNHLKFYIFTALLALLSLTSANAQIYINEIYFNPAGTDNPNEYIELRGTPGLTVGSGTYLLFLEGDNPTTPSTTAGARPGDIGGIFDLSGKAFGSNGYMVMRQFGSPYSVNPNASSYTATSTSWGGLGFNTSATAAGDIENISFTALVVTIGGGAAPVWGSQLDVNNDGLLELDSSWTILDSIGVGDTGANDRLYGAVNFSGAASGTVTSNGGLLQYLNFNEIEYLARVADSTGNTLADWAVADVGFTAPATVVDSIVNGPDATSGVQESWNLSPGVRITDTLGSTNPVPEPSSAALLGFGTLALLALRRISRKS
jgi:PEP-CTERM motif